MSQRDVKNRIASVQNIRKITRAMEMVAAARLRRAEQRIEHLRPYAGAIRRMTRQAAEAAGGEMASLPILRQHESEQRIALLLVTADRGLAGAFNSQVLRRGFALGHELEGEGQTIRWLVAGKKGRSTLRFRGYEVASDWTGFSDRPAYTDAQAIAHTLTEQYVEGEFDRVILVYNHFDSPLVQKVTEQEVLPIPEHLLETDDDERRDDAMRGDFIYEPEPEEILARLLPVYLETELYRALLESAASEQGARMTAMRNASKNAGELIDSLTLAMNRARQAEITQEILEVVAGADALEG
jgi:F-type H+-transporting ATPase subunit gamma